MKKRRTLIISLLLVAALALGIAYAAVDGVLIVDGKVQTVKQPFNVHFSAFSQGDAHAEVTGNLPAVTCQDTFPSKSIMLNVSGMASQGDYVEANLTIHNENDCTMYVHSPVVKYGTTIDDTTHDTSDNINVEVFYNGALWTDAIPIDVDATVDIVVKITMKKSCTADTYQEFFRMTVTGSPTNPNT